MVFYETHHFNVGNGSYRRIFPPVIPPVSFLDIFKIKPTLPSLAMRRNPNIQPPSEPPKPRRCHSPSSPHPNLRSPTVVFSVTANHGGGSLEYHQDPHLVGAVLGNGAVDPTLAVRVSWRRRGDVAAATTTVEPPWTSFVTLNQPLEYLEDRTSKARTTAVLPRSPVFAVLPRSPIFGILLFFGRFLVSTS
ncbi:hypothetical protein PIB30_053379 [Stylosanthes scabra]|uniref:Uncharacterized protein n=1 Tax=Stylosanthes scabra TaxID=79078 RepID=A0ABU6SID7_9FABA|nr:hypothetical protein [Stylosanthes scabra]